MTRASALLSLILVAGATSVRSQNQAPVDDDSFYTRCFLGWQWPAPSVAIPELATASSNVMADTVELYRVLFEDLSFAPAFRIVNPERYALVETPEVGFDYHDMNSKSFDYHGWKSIGTDVVIDGTVSSEGQLLHVEIHVHSVSSEETIFAKRYTGRHTAIRKLAHYISDDTLNSFGWTSVATTHIAFASDRDSENGRPSLWLMDYDGADQHPITSDGYVDFQPRYSPDGATLTFLSHRTENAPSAIAILGRMEPLFERSGDVSSFSWSPDGERVAFSSTRDDAGNSEIYVMNRDGGHVLRWTDHPSTDVSPTWSPTGEELAFTSDRTGSLQIFVMAEGGLNMRKLPLKGPDNAEPAWSPSKIHPEIAYISRVDGSRYDIVVYDLATHQERQLTSGSGVNENPSWSHDGRHLAFSSRRTGEPQIFIMDRNGANQRQLTFEGSNTSPSWSPRPAKR